MIRSKDNVKMQNDSKKSKDRSLNFPIVSKFPSCADWFCENFLGK